MTSWHACCGTGTGTGTGYDEKPPLNDTEPAPRPISVRDLLSNRTGMGAIFTTGSYPF